MTDEKEFFELGKRMPDRLNPPQRDWVETNNQACAILRQVHDMLALASYPPRKTWVGLTDAEKNGCLVSADPCECLATPEAQQLMEDVETKLKEKNT